MLSERYGVSADVFSATSYQQLRTDALACERFNRLHPTEEPQVPYVTSELGKGEGPIVATSDFMKLLPDMIGRWVPGDFTPLGTDGFGLSDTREALRRHFETDAEHVVVAALAALARVGKGSADETAAAIRDLAIDPDAPDPATV
jgi:pyruvate dehydrogenase E1 component